MLDGGGVGQAGVGAAQLLGDVRVQRGSGCARAPRRSPSRSTATGGRSVVLPVEAVRRRRRSGARTAALSRPSRTSGSPRQLVVDPVPEHLGPPGDVALDRPGVGVEQQLGGVVPQPVGRAPRTVRPAGRSAGPAPMPGTKPNHVPWARSVEPDRALGRAVGVALVEQADLDRRRRARRRRRSRRRRRRRVTPSGGGRSRTGVRRGRMAPSVGSRYVRTMSDPTSLPNFPPPAGRAPPARAGPRRPHGPGLPARHRLRRRRGVQGPGPAAVRALPRGRLPDHAGLRPVADRRRRPAGPADRSCRPATT